MTARQQFKVGDREGQALIEAADRVATTLEMPTLVKQSTKNPNAGFIDWRDWMALQGEVKALRDALRATFTNTTGGAK